MFIDYLVISVAVNRITHIAHGCSNSFELADRNGFSLVQSLGTQRIHLNRDEVPKVCADAHVRCVERDVSHKGIFVQFIHHSHCSTL